MSGSGLAVCAFGLARMSLVLFPGWRWQQIPWAQWLAVIVMPETVSIIAAVVLWRRRRNLATGILLGAGTLIAHVIFHVATHG